MRILIVLCLLLCAGCATQPASLTRQDYQKSQQAFLHGDDKGALFDFPHGAEDGNFITSEEKAYLSLIQGAPQIDGLQAQENLQLSLKPQNYHPSAHERIWMHLLLGWGYADQGKYIDAAAEARLSRNLLALPASSKQHFDDPMLRVFLAGLWTMCGQWQEARTDLQAAWGMDHSLKWVKELADRDHAPAQLFIVLGGPGPIVVWDPSHGRNPLRASRKVTFILRGRKSALTMQDAYGLEIKTYRSPDANPWYIHSLTQESEQSGMLQDLTYGGNSIEGGIASSVVFTGVAVVDVLYDTVVGALAGPAILAVSDSTNNSSAFTAADYRAAAFTGAVAGAFYGVIDGIHEGQEAASDEYSKLADPATRYRYVRYLPEYLWLGWSEQPVAYPVTLRTPLQMIKIPGPSVVNGTAVTLAHLADVFPSLCRYSSEDGSATILAPRDKSGLCPLQPPY